MAKLEILAGSTSQSINIFIQDSSSTTGQGLAGLVFNTAGLAAYYSFAGANATATSITLATLGAVNSAYSSGGFIELDATHMKGWYRFDIPNAAIAASKGRIVSIHFYGATNMAPCPLEIELTGWDNQDGVRAGLTALPSVAQGNAGAILTSGTGTAQLKVTGGYAGIDWAQVNNQGSSVTLSGTRIADLSSTGLDQIVMSDLAAGAPSATATLKVALNYLYENWRNKRTQTSSTYTLMKDDGSTTLVSAGVTDDGTVFTRNELA